MFEYKDRLKEIGAKPGDKIRCWREDNRYPEWIGAVKEDSEGRLYLEAAGGGLYYPGIDDELESAENIQRNDNKTVKWAEKEAGLYIEPEILDYDTPVRGVYGIFIGKEEYCAYVGRAENIYGRMFRSGGHLVKMRLRAHESERIMEEMGKDDKKIAVKILERVKLEGDDFCKDMQRLASAENHWIDKYQGIGQCLEQLPEGHHLEQETWEQLFPGKKAPRKKGTE